MHYLKGMDMPRRSSSRGPAQTPGPVRAFTFIEVLVILILVSILTVALLPKKASMGEDAISVAEVLKTRLRYAQIRSLNNMSVHGICSTGSSYWLFYNGDTGNRERFPGANSNTITLPSNVSMDSFIVSFDSRGVPYTNAGATAGNELVTGSAAASITVGGKAGAVLITPGTGYIRN